MSTEENETVVEAAGQDTAPASTGIDWNTIIPEDLRSKDYFQNVLKAENPGSELVKQFDNAQQLIGKKGTSIPAADASEEDWNKFYQSARPASSEEYEIKPVSLGEDKKHLADLINAGRDEDFTKSIKTMLYKHGLTKKQAEGLASDYDQLSVSSVEKTYSEKIAAETQLNAQFDDVFKKHFGGDKDKAVQLGKKVIDDFVPENIRKTVDSWSNEQLAVLAAIGKQVADKYETQDKFSTTTTSAATGNTIEGVETEMNTLIASPAYLNSFEPNSEHVRARVKDLSARLTELRKKG